MSRRPVASLQRACCLLSCFFLLGLRISFGQHQADSLQLLIQAALDHQPDSQHQVLLRSSLDSLRSPTFASNDSAFMAFCVDLAFQIKDPKAGLPFMAFIERLAKRFLLVDSPPPFQSYYQTSLLRALDKKSYYYDVLADRVNGLSAKIDLLSFAEQFGDTSFIILSLQKIGFNYFNLQDYDNAGKRFFRAYDLAKQAFGDSVSLATYYTLFEYYNATDSAEQKIREFADLTIQQAQVDHNPYYEGLIYRGLAYYYYKKKQYPTCYTYAKKALELFEANNETYWIGPMAYRLVSTCIELGNLKEAAMYLEQLAAVTRSENTPRGWSLYHESAHEYYAATGNYQLALKHYAAHIDIQDSLNSASIKQQTYDLQYEYEYRQKSLTDSLHFANQLALQAAETRRGRTISYFLIALLVIISVFGWILWNRFRLIRAQKLIIEEEKGKLNEANAKLQELDNFKSRFFTNISHEFRTPLTVIKGMTQQIRLNQQKWVNKGVDLIEQNADNLLHLINQILDLRKLESGNLSLSLVNGEVVSFLRSQTEAFRTWAEDRELALRFHSDVAQQFMDYDPDKLLLILSNLLSNAIKFTQPNGQVTVHVSRAKDHALLIDVSDTGIGIAADKLPLIFDRFYQADHENSQTGEGTGIGLSLTRELVQLMGGQIHVTSTQREGSTFQVILPIRQEAQSVAEPQTVGPPIQVLAQVSDVTVQAPHLQGEELPRLLIVEDNPDVVTYLFACLEGSYQLMHAKDGAEGVAMAIEQVPDLIISDVMMPKMNGYQVCDSLKTDERTSHIPIVLLTAKADRASRLEGLGQGADAYLTKPFDREELFIRLEKLLALRRQLQARYAHAAISPPPAEAAFEREDAFILKVRSTLLAEIDNSEYRIEDLCRDLGISRTQLFKKTKALTGKSTSHFIRSIRLEKAKEFLLTTNLQVAEVAYEVGFGDPYYFSRVFTKDIGSSPTTWREAQKS